MTHNANRYYNEANDAICNLFMPFAEINNVITPPILIIKQLQRFTFLTDCSAAQLLPRIEPEKL